jgi:hypothetical protein
MWLGDKLKIKATILLMALMLSLTIPLLTAKAQTIPPDVYVYAWVDKSQYMPGETGTLYITVLNTKDNSVDVRNITIRYQWFAYVKDHWEGNETVKNINAPVGSKGGYWNTEKTFKVPEDGRIVSSGPLSISIYVTIQDGPSVYSRSPYSSPMVNIANPTLHMTVKDVDKILTMITVAAVLMIVSAIIVAAAVFVAGRGRKAVSTA